MAADRGMQMKAPDGRIVTVVQQTTVRRHKVRTIPVLSIPRILKMVLLWLGAPVGAILIVLLPDDGPARHAVFLWFAAGLLTLALNAAGLVTIRGRKMVVEEDGETG